MVEWTLARASQKPGFCIHWYVAVRLASPETSTLWKVVLPRLLVQETLLDFLKVACKDSSLIAGAVAQARSGCLLACA